MNNSSTTYTSNPFSATAKRLVSVLSTNPTAAMSVIAYAVGYGIIALLLGGFATAVLPGASKVLAIIAIIIAIVYFLLKVYAATILIIDASQNDTPVTGKQALHELAKPRFAAFVWLTLLRGIIIGIGLVFVIIPGLIIGARLALAPYAFYNEQLSPMAAIKRSWTLTKGHTWEMFGAIVASSIALGTSGGLLSILGAEAGSAQRFYELQAAADADTGSVHRLNYIAPVVVTIGIVAYLLLVGVSSVMSFNDLEDVSQPSYTDSQMLPNSPDVDDTDNMIR